MQKFIFVNIVAVAVAGVNTIVKHDVYSQNMTNANANNLIEIENDSSSASVTAKLNISTPQPEARRLSNSKPNRSNN
jgi:hypothetical protein